MTKFILFLLIFLTKLFVNLCQTEDSSEMSTILKSFEKSQYNKHIRPNLKKGPVIINVTMMFNDVVSVSETDMDFTVDIYLRQSWNDERLAFNKTDIENITVGQEFATKLWLPDTVISNGKQIIIHKSINLESNSFARIRANGDIMYSVRLTVVAMCRMNLRYFPMDTQICKIDLESYGNNDNDLSYRWGQWKGLYSNGVSSHISLPNLRVIHSFTGTRTFISETEGLSFTVLSSGLVFTRSMVYYLNQVYVPAIMIVAISWIPFWLDRDDNHARVGLGVTTVLTMTTLVTNTNESMPKISYMKSLDIYLEVCFAMVFASLIQYAVVGYYTSKSGNKVCHQLEDNRDLISFGGHKPLTIDVHSRWVFPFVFLVFNFVYWITYSTLSRVTLE